jgi:hypothetical protein
MRKAAGVAGLAGIAGSIRINSPVIFLCSCFPVFLLSCFYLSCFHIIIWSLFQKCITHEQYASSQENVSENRRSCKASQGFFERAKCGEAGSCVRAGRCVRGGKCIRRRRFDSHKLNCAFIFSFFLSLFVIPHIFLFSKSIRHEQCELPQTDVS